MRREQGFTLIEVIVVMGLLSIAAYIFMHTSKMRALERRTQRANEEIDQYFENIKGLMMREAYCLASLSEVELNPDNLEEKYLFNAIQTPAQFPKYETGQILEALVILKELSLQDFIPANNNLTTFLVTVHVQFEKKGEVYGGKSLTKSFDLEIMLNDKGEITACYPLSQASANAPAIEDVPDVQDVLRMQGQEPPSKKEIQEAIENNPFLKELYEQSQEIRKANELLKESL